MIGESGPDARAISKDLRGRIPLWIKQLLNNAYWLAYDTRDYVCEVVGWLPSNRLRCLFWRGLGVEIGKHTSIHRNCRFYRPSHVIIGGNTIVNRDVLLDGRRGLYVGDNVSISEGTLIFTLEHDPNSLDFTSRGDEVRLEDYVFVGARAIILPGITISRGGIVAAGAVVTHDVAPYTIVAGVPAQVIGVRSRELRYTLNYRKFLG